MSGNVAADAHFQPMRFGNYLLLDRINVGGMAEVFRAKSSGMAGVERLVAIKRILPNLAQDPDFTNMFIDEARIAIHLRHSNIAQIYELNEIGQSLFIAMEYVQGRDLRALINRMRFLGREIPLPLIVYIISRVCDGLDYAHRKRDDLSMRDLNIVHRDVSPQNVILSYEGEVKIIDFGIAKASAKRTHTQAGILKGKFGYMAPEQVMGHDIDRRADIFCTGILSYELLTRERLFSGSNELSTLRRIRQREITPPTIVNPAIPKPIEEMVLQALALDPDDRFSYASDYGDALQKALVESGLSPCSSRDLREFMHEVFGKDLSEDLMRLEAVLQRADELEQNGVLGNYAVLSKPLRARLSESPESVSEGTSEQTNPSWHSDGLSEALSESVQEEIYPDTPSPFADKQATSPNSLDPKTSPTAELSSNEPDTQSSKRPTAPSTPRPASDVYSTVEADFMGLSAQWDGGAEDPHGLDPKSLLPSASDPAVRDDEIPILERVEPPPAPVFTPLPNEDKTKDIKKPRPTEPNPASLSLSSAIPESQQAPPTQESFAPPAIPLQAEPELFLPPEALASPAPASRTLSAARNKRRQTRTFIFMWGFLGISFLLLLYLLLIVPPPGPVVNQVGNENQNNAKPVQNHTPAPRRGENKVPARGRTAPSPARKSQPARSVPPARTKVVPRTAPEKRASPSTVSFQVVTRPAKAQVVLNGASKGRAPLKLNVPTSTKELQFRIRKQGYKTLWKTVKVSELGTKPLTFVLRRIPLKKGFLSVMSTPPAVIYINGITTEKKVLQRHPLRPGKYQISFVTKDGDLWDEKVMVRSGRETVIHSRYKKKK
ncbi:MAG: PEGA domain-containing protein [Deltaproteobacteria bacterium]|nr:MAG: PEGA domain-containing protein [Deltaproteobacteria bacterium]